MGKLRRVFTHGIMGNIINLSLSFNSLELHKWATRICCAFIGAAKRWEGTVHIGFSGRAVHIQRRLSIYLPYAVHTSQPSRSPSSVVSGFHYFQIPFRVSRFASRVKQVFHIVGI